MDEVELLVSELVINVVVYGVLFVMVNVECDGIDLCVVVIDGSDCLLVLC